MPLLDKIREQLKKAGYIELSNYKIPKKLLWKPDLVFSKDKYTFLILVKSNNTIPASFLNRISSIPNNKLIPFIIFAQKVNKHTENLILSSGISIAYSNRGRLVNIKIKKRRSQTAVKREIQKKLQVIDIFISSKQNIPEREFIKKRINLLRETNSYPFNPPHLIEYDKFSMKDVYKYIDEVMKNCEWILIILEANDSDIVKYEINKAIKIIEHNNVFMFVKSTSNCHNTWKKELNRIKKLESIKYLPYTDLNDLEVNFIRAVHKRMQEICKKEKVEIFT